METYLVSSKTKDLVQTRQKNFCLVIPTFNERENIDKIVSRLKTIKDSLPVEMNVVVVDDNSSDGTLQLVRKLMIDSRFIQVLNRPSLLGIGSAYLDGFAFGFSETESDFFGEMDADLQHPPEVLIQMCKAAIRGADVVVASRYIKGGGSKGWTLTRRIVSKSANLLARLCIRVPVSDSTSGFRILSARAVKGLLQSRISTMGYAFQIESLYVYKKLGMTFVEVPYQFEERKSGETKLRWKEMLNFAKTAIKLGIFGMSVGNE